MQPNRNADVSTPGEAAELTLMEACPVHVFDAHDLSTLYQNPLSLELFGELVDYAAYQALRDTGLDALRPKLHGVLRLMTRLGPRSYLVERHDTAGGIVHLLKDITELEAGLDDLYREQHSDPLTKTLNRRALVYALVRELCRAERTKAPLQLLLVDVDGVAAINREYGREAGDCVIANTGDLILSTIRPTDVLGRYEGDRFALLLAGTDAAGGRWVAERTRQLVASAPVSLGGRRLAVTVCVGVAAFERGDSPGSILGRAGDALERAMARGVDQAELD
jgi:diguanylate cyclase (GGDEF)-like protein